MSKNQIAQDTIQGTDALTGSAVSVRFGQTIQALEAAASGDGLFVAPAWIDVQVNGFAGVDYNDPGSPQEQIARSVQVLHSTGVGRFFPTVITGAPENMCGALRNLAQAKDKLPAIEGFHVEGPHISPDDGPRGAHPRRWVRRPDLHEFHRMQEAARGGIKLVTVSPEWPESPRFIERLTEQGVTVSIGHLNATAEQVQTAVAAGARMSTHLGNGAHRMLRRHPNYIWEQLAEDRLAAGFIVDGIHLGWPFLKAALRAKGPDRAVLVTDASTPAGATPGRYRLGEQELELTPDQRVVLAGTDQLAGSALRLNDGIANVVHYADQPLAAAVRMVTLNPARVLCIAGRENGLTPGDRADLVVFDADFRILKTYLLGELVYSA